MLKKQRKCYIRKRELTFLGKGGSGVWITSEVEIPDELFDKFEQGKLVLFVGAGVSMKGNSNLPNFDDLVDDIANALYVDKREENEPHDYYLGKIAKTKDVHQIAKNLVHVADSKPNPLHYSILQLFSVDENVRIVTTNFDRHFSTVIEESKRKANIYYAPALPTGRAFKGLAYIHGNVEQEEENLILTDGDFGRAYLTEGWARRFLVDLFSNYTVLFIGYSHNDPVMKYLATGLPPSTRRYAFVAQGDNTYHWEHLGIKPIVYPNKSQNHQSLAKAVQRWAELMGDNYITKRTRIRDIVTVPPSLEQEQLSYVKQSIKKIETLRYFVEFARDYEWVEWLEKDGQLRNLFSEEAETSEKDQLLAKWIVDHFLVSHQNELFQLMYKNNTEISALLWNTICTFLVDMEQPIHMDTFAKWLLLLLEKARENEFFIENLPSLLHKCTYPKHKEIIVLLFTCILDGKLKLKRLRQWEPEMQDVVELAETNHLSDTTFSKMQHIWEVKIKPHLSYFSIPILQVGLEKLQRLGLKQQALQIHDSVSESRSAIEPHEQDSQPRGFSFLINIVRDCMDYVCVHFEDKANFYISFMMEFGNTLQKRIAVHSMNHTVFRTQNEKIEWLLQHQMLTEDSCKHEVFQLLKNHYEHVSEHTKQKVLTTIEKQFEEKTCYLACNLIDWLYMCDPTNERTKRTYEFMKQKFPHFLSRQFPDLQEERTLQTITCNLTTDGLLHMKEEEMIRQVLQYSQEGLFEKHHFLEMLSKACKTNVQWSISLAYQLVKYKEVSKEVWFVFIREWRNNRKLTDKQMQELLPLLHQFVRHATYHWIISSFLYEKSNQLAEFQEETIRAIKQLAFSMFPHVMKGEHAGSKEQVDYYNEAAQHPVGKTTAVLLKLLAYEHLYDRNIHAYLYVFEEQMRKKSYYVNIMIARLTADLTFLYHIEKHWCRKHMIPYLDLQQNEEETKYAWAGFVNTQINLPLFIQTKKYIAFAVRYLHLLNKQTQEVFMKWLSLVFLKCILYWDKQLDWLNTLFIQGEEVEKVKFVENVSYYVKSLSIKEQQKFWRNWLADFLVERPKMSIIAEKEYIIFLRFVLYMDVIAEKGIETVLSYFSITSLQEEKQALKELLKQLLEKNELIHQNSKVYATLFFVLLTKINDAECIENEVIHLWLLFDEMKLENTLLERIQNEIMRIGMINRNENDSHLLF
ncbi:DUF4020 domain-containing protein [Bacillus sp. WLY-B-L8]|uniref:DUF4020 domain-containing protein n=1 Tax=Bacillus multifaciens TaxID=3068506 RepID=UPI0027414C26|nr:DUF4020 domain-containing protein [Bacillus sp. WLY-B-L8]MDP7978110.1 DUF4020 domain-containing protein [Bacillus sp. WLY-B-L8]